MIFATISASLSSLGAKSNTNGKPGNIVGENFEVCCGENSIKVLSIQREGKRAQKINEFLPGSQIKKGSNIA